MLSVQSWRDRRSVSVRTSKARRAGQMMLMAVAMAMPAAAQAADVVKENNADALNLGTSWVGGVAPTANDVAVWNSNLATPANGVESLAAATTWGGLKVVDPSGPISIDLTGKLTIGASGIDMTAATQDLTITSSTLTAIGTAIGYTGARQSWNVANGRTLTIGAPLTAVQVVQTSSNLVTIGTTGSVVFSGTGGQSQALLANNGKNAYYMYGADDWAGTDATGKVTAATYSNDTAGSANMNLTGAVTTLSVGAVTSTYRFANASAPVAITQTGLNTNRGILMTSSSVGASITGNTIRSDRGAATNGVLLPIVQNSLIGDLNISSSFGNASSSTTSLAKYGPGNLILSNPGGNGYGNISPGRGFTSLYEGTITVANTTGTATGTGPVTVSSAPASPAPAGSAAH
ncbi:MAG: hypothetical protein QM770_05450 [Tepidisphaeraceae bacterium]